MALALAPVAGAARNPPPGPLGPRHRRPGCLRRRRSGPRPASWRTLARALAMMAAARRRAACGNLSGRPGRHGRNELCKPWAKRRGRRPGIAPPPRSPSRRGHGRVLPVRRPARGDPAGAGRQSLPGQPCRAARDSGAWLRADAGASAGFQQMGGKIARAGFGMISAFPCVTVPIADPVGVSKRGRPCPSSAP